MNNIVTGNIVNNTNNTKDIKDQNNNEIVQCPICDNYFGIFDIEDHVDLCYVLLESERKVDDTIKINKIEYTEPELTERQIAAYKYCKKKAKIHSDQTKKLAAIRFAENGYEEYHAETINNYIKNIVKITINIKNETVLKFLQYESKIKNGYEIGRYQKSNINTCGRNSWESNLFNGIYDDAEDFERVKYGAVNIFNEPNGISVCFGYGDSFFVLKDELKSRTTFVCGDSCAKMLHICTFKYCEQLLIHPQNSHFRAIVDNIIGKSNKSNQSFTFPYIEAQIHGPIRLNMDIEKYCIKKSIFEKMSNDKKNELNQFCEVNNIEFVILNC